MAEPDQGHLVGDAGRKVAQGFHAEMAQRWCIKYITSAIQGGENMETWKDLPGHPDYMVSSYGRIKRIDSGRIYTGNVNNKGYIRFDLCENGKRFVVSGHRAVATAFLSPVERKTLVNHKDGNKCNNHLENLEWCTSHENNIHAYRVLNKQPSKIIPVICVETGIVYKSAWDAEKKTGIRNTLINRCIHGKRKTTHGFHWKRAEVAQR